MCERLVAQVSNEPEIAVALIDRGDGENSLESHDVCSLHAPEGPSCSETYVGSQSLSLRWIKSVTPVDPRQGNVDPTAHKSNCL